MTEFDNITKFDVYVSFARRKARFARQLFKTVPRADVLTDVAAIHPTGKVLFDL